MLTDGLLPGETRGIAELSLPVLQVVVAEKEVELSIPVSQIVSPAAGIPSEEDTGTPTVKPTIPISGGRGLIVGGPLLGDNVALKTKAAVCTASAETITAIVVANVPIPIYLWSYVDLCLSLLLHKVTIDRDNSLPFMGDLLNLIIS